jgi:hypothetical protein
VWRAAPLSAAVLAVVAGAGGSMAVADDPAPGEIVVEVGLPPVPPTTVVVEVGPPPVPPTAPSVEADLPPLPPLPDTYGDDTVADVTGAIAGAIASTANAAWQAA